MVGGGDIGKIINPETGAKPSHHASSLSVPAVAVVGQKLERERARLVRGAPQESVRVAVSACRAQEFAVISQVADDKRGGPGVLALGHVALELTDARIELPHPALHGHAQQMVLDG